MRARVSSETDPPPFRTLLVVWKLTPERAATSFTETCRALRSLKLPVLCASESERSPEAIRRAWKRSIPRRRIGRRRPLGTPSRVPQAGLPPARLDQPERRVGVRHRPHAPLQRTHSRALLSRVEAVGYRPASR